MNIISTILKFLNEPYPDDDDLPSISRDAAIAGVVVFILLFVFQPFGLHQTGRQVIWYCLGFGLITFFVTVAYDLIIKYVFLIRRGEYRWTLWKWSLSVFILVFLIGTANYFFLGKLIALDMNLENYFAMMKGTMKVAIFPILLFGSINMFRHLHVNQRLAKEMSSSLSVRPSSEIIDLPIHHSEKTFQIDVATILFIEAKQNYVLINHEQSGILQQTTIRNTMKVIESALSHTTVKKCHRSFLVNTNYVTSFSGNAQGLKLTLDQIPDFKVPVSRKYISLFK